LQERIALRKAFAQRRFPAAGYKPAVSIGETYEFTLDGRGELLRAGCVFALIDSNDRGHAFVRVSPLGPNVLINDRDINNRDCVCR
jgi:hypothetical protein